MIWAKPSDHASIRGFLHDHIHLALFTLSNWDRHGVDQDHPRSPSFLIRRENGRITDVLAYTKGGSLMPTAPTRNFEGAAHQLWGKKVNGMIGAATEVAALKTALGLNAATNITEPEPQYELPLTSLIVPDTTGLTLHPLQAAPLETLVAWRTHYHIETMGTDKTKAPAVAKRDIDGYITDDSHRVLMRADEPVAMTGFNARTEKVVQIGGVYTRPDLRGQGLACAALALHLTEAHATGVNNAYLAAANQTAARVYERLGFRYIGMVALMLFKEPQVIDV